MTPCTCVKQVEWSVEFYYATTIISQKYAHGDELKWLLKEGGGCIFAHCFGN